MLAEVAARQAWWTGSDSDAWVDSGASGLDSDAGVDSGLEHSH
jgi:hypothetical protein